MSAVTIARIGTQIARTVIGLSDVARVRIEANGHLWNFWLMSGGMSRRVWDYQLLLGLWVGNFTGAALTSLSTTLRQPRPTRITPRKRQGRRARARGDVDLRDAEVEAIVGSWPAAARAERALALGLPKDQSPHAIVRAYCDGT